MRHAGEVIFPEDGAVTVAPPAVGMPTVSRVQELPLWPPAALAVHRLGGRASRTDLLRLVTRRQLDAAVAAGRVLRVAKGQYLLAPLSQAVATAAACRGVLSHETAAAHHRLASVFPPRAVHVTVARGSRAPAMDDVVLHRTQLPGEDVSGLATSVLGTVLDCAVTMPFREALAIADSAARQSPTFVDELRAAASRRRGPGAGRCMRVAAAASAAPENPFESAARGTLLESGLVGFEPQVTILTVAGSVRVDLADVRQRIVVEADSFEWHGNRQALAADCRRYDELTRAGWRVLRFAWEQVMFEEEWLAEVVCDVVARRRVA
jgi:very-short-patch-repair endonuclease